MSVVSNRLLETIRIQRELKACGSALDALEAALRRAQHGLSPAKWEPNGKEYTNPSGWKTRQHVTPQGIPVIELWHPRADPRTMHILAELLVAVADPFSLGRGRFWIAV